MRRTTLYLREHEIVRGVRGAWRTLARAAGFAALALLPLAVLAPPAAGQNGGQAIRDRAEIRQDQRDLANGRDDFRTLRRLIRHLDWARARGDRLAESRYRSQIYDFLYRELAETSREVAEDRMALRQAQQEGPRDRRERDDLRDDRRDLTASQERLHRERAIVRELRSLRPGVYGGDWRAIRRERALFGEFLALVQQDAVQSAQELQDDRRGPWQDRRGSWEDRRERGTY